MFTKSILPADSYKKCKRILIAVAGGTVLLIGIALIVLPGPAFVVIPAGLAILAIEFTWAKRWLRKLKKLIPKTRSGEPKGKEPEPPRAPSA